MFLILETPLLRLFYTNIRHMRIGQLYVAALKVGAQLGADSVELETPLCALLPGMK
jgi:hypothetical protein